MIKQMVRRAKRRLTGFARESDGASAVEFALVFPFAFFIAGAFELGMLMFNQAAIEFGGPRGGTLRHDRTGYGG